MLHVTLYTELSTVHAGGGYSAMLSRTLIYSFRFLCFLLCYANLIVSVQLFSFEACLYAGPLARGVMSCSPRQCGD